MRLLIAQMIVFNDSSITIDLNGGQKIGKKGLFLVKLDNKGKTNQKFFTNVSYKLLLPMQIN